MEHAFARAWIDAWNTHDLEAILAHYAEDVVVTSPRAAVVVPESGGVIRGKSALRAYWGKALLGAPDLRFELEDVLPTVGGLTLLYRNHRRQRAAETCLFGADGLVTQSWVAYTPGAPVHVVTAHVPPGGVAAFAAYEATVLPLLGGYGGRLERRLRSSDGTTEVHLVRIEPDALDRYRADPARIAAAPLLAESGARVEVVVMEEV